MIFYLFIFFVQNEWQVGIGTVNCVQEKSHAYLSQMLLDTKMSIAIWNTPDRNLIEIGFPDFFFGFFLWFFFFLPDLKRRKRNPFFFFFFYQIFFSSLCYPDFPDFPLIFSILPYFALFFSNFLTRKGGMLLDAIFPRESSSFFFYSRGAWLRVKQKTYFFKCSLSPLMKDTLRNTSLLNASFYSQESWNLHFCDLVTGGHDTILIFAFLFNLRIYFW